MNRIVRKLVQRTPLVVMLLGLSIALTPTLSLVSTIHAAPSRPSKPEAPKAPEEPEAPEAPDAPEAPEAPSWEEEEESSDGGSESKEDSSGDSSSSGDNESDSSDETETNENESGTAEDTANEPEAPPEEVLPENTVVEESGSVSSDGGVGGDVEVESGDANSASAVTNTGNLNAAASPSGAGGNDVYASNTGNGADSTNDINAALGDQSILIQENTADVVNDIDQGSTSGKNSASRNTGGDVELESGDANASTTVVNALNTNAAGVQVAEFNVIDDQLGDLILDFDAACVAGCGGQGSLFAKNDGNGTGSDNGIGISEYDDTMTFQNNDADIENDIVLFADSGNNNATDNTNGDVSLETGDANVSANVLNFANTNIAGNAYLGVVNLYGDLIGDIILPDSYFSGCDCGADTSLANTGNGSGSDNNIAYQDLDQDAIFQFNDALINNEIVVDTNTGGNNASDNTSGDVALQTGDSNVDLGILNVANTNMIGGDWWLVLVNQAGQWVGQIMGAPEGATFAGSEGTQFGAGPSGELTAVNTGNGSNSDNNIEVTDSDSEVIVQENKASIDNKLDLTANTGNNDASRNTGGDVEITTGDANIAANIVNFVNTNIVGDGRLFVTVVNVFGTWLGDFVTPGSQPNPVSESAVVAEGNNPGGIGAPVEASDTNDELTTVASVSNADNSDSGNSDDDEETPAVAARNSSSGGSGLLAGLFNSNNTGTVDSPSSEEVAGISTDVSSDVVVAPSAKHVVNINLAWALLLLPLALVRRLGIFGALLP